MKAHLIRKGILYTICFLCFLPMYTQAHAPNQSYVYLRVFTDRIEGSIQSTFKDLNNSLGINLQKGATEADLQPYIGQIRAYFLNNLSFKSDQGVHPITFSDIDFIRTVSLGDFVILDFDLGNVGDIPDDMDVRYTGIYPNDPIHKGMLLIEYNWRAGIINNESMPTLIFDSDDPEQNFSLKERSLMRGFIAMIESGMWHIYIGLDHILFLVALLLPAVVYRRKERAEATATIAASGAQPIGGWFPVGKFKPAFFYVLKIVTLFTIANTITLSLAALQIVTLPGRIVESIIALSIALAAFHNIRPFIKNETLVIAFGFGLFHGFGFASVLSEVGLRGEFMVYSLLGFNIGVELGQLSIIAVVFPVLYLMRKWKFYPLFVVAGSVLLIIISAYWFIERFFEVDLVPGLYAIRALEAIGLM